MWIFQQRIYIKKISAMNLNQFAIVSKTNLKNLCLTLKTSGNELRELQCQTNRSTNHFQKGALDGINKISTDAVDVSEKPILTCDSNNAPNNTNFTVKKVTEHNILECNSEEKEIKK